MLVFPIEGKINGHLFFSMNVYGSLDLLIEAEIVPSTVGAAVTYSRAPTATARTGALEGSIPGIEPSRCSDQ